MRLKFQVTLTEGDYIDYGFHAFINKRGMTRNVIIGVFFLFLIIQTVREIMANESEYLYLFMLLVFVLFPPINIYTSYKGYFKRNWASDNVANYTIDDSNIRIKRNKGVVKKEFAEIDKITQNKKSIFIWWKKDIDTGVIPKRFLSEDEIKEILALNIHAPKIEANDGE